MGSPIFRSTGWLSPKTMEMIDSSWVSEFKNDKILSHNIHFKFVKNM